jgi:hypothetical protein
MRSVVRLANVGEAEGLAASIFDISADPRRVSTAFAWRILPMERSLGAKAVLRNAEFARAFSNDRNGPA